MAGREPPQHFALRGGLNLVSSALETPPGHVIAGLNYEPHPRGYQRIDGIERFDGRAKPSDASYWVLNFDAGTDVPAVDDIVHGQSSEATGVVVAVAISSGSWAGNDAAGYLIIYSLSGTFVDDEFLENMGASGSEYDSSFNGDFS